MNLFYLSAIVIINILMVAMIFHINHYSVFTPQQKVWFDLTYVATIICSIAEFCVHGIPYDDKYRTVLSIITVIQFSIAPMIGVFFSGALGLHRQAKRFLNAMIINVIIEIVSSPFGKIFYFNENGYHRGQWFLVYMTFYFVALIYLGISMIIAGRNFKHRDKMTIIMSMVLLISGILPVTFVNVHTAYIAIGAAACLCYIYYNDLVQEDTKTDLITKEKKINLMQRSIVIGLANLIESRDTETGEHVTRTQDYVNKLAIQAQKDGIYPEEIDDEFIDLVTRLAPLHDVGKIVVSDTILRKQGKLTPEERKQMEQHTVVADKIVRQVFSNVTDEKVINFASDIATYHHEWWDGSGYPKGISGKMIPLSARIMALADVYDALISERCYKPPFTKEEAIKIIKSESGTHFDPILTEEFLKIVE